MGNLKPMNDISILEKNKKYQRKYKLFTVKYPRILQCRQSTQCLKLYCTTSRILCGILVSEQVGEAVSGEARWEDVLILGTKL